MGDAKPNSNGLGAAPTRTARPTTNAETDKRTSPRTRNKSGSNQTFKPFLRNQQGDLDKKAGIGSKKASCASKVDLFEAPPKHKKNSSDMGPRETAAAHDIQIAVSAGERLSYSLGVDHILESIVVGKQLHLGPRFLPVQIMFSGR